MCLHQLGKQKYAGGHSDRFGVTVPNNIHPLPSAPEMDLCEGHLKVKGPGLQLWLLSRSVVEPVVPFLLPWA